MTETMRININNLGHMDLFNKVSDFQNRNRSCVMWMNQATFNKMKKIYPSVLFHYMKDFNSYYGYLSHMNECFAVMLMNYTVEDDIIILKKSHLVGKVTSDNGVIKIDSDLISISKELSMKNI